MSLAFLTAFAAAQTANAAFDITLTVDGSTVVDVGQFRGITVSYAWASLTQDLANAKIEVQLPASLDTDSTSDVQVFGSAHTTAASYDTATRKITFTFLNPLPAGSSGTVSFNTRFPTSAADGTLANIVGTSSGTGQSNATSSVTLEANANLVTDLLMEKWSNIYPMLSQDVTYTIRVRNNGTTDYLSPHFVDQLPAGTTFVSATDGGVYNAGANTVTWNLATIGAGGSHSVDVTVRYNGPTFSTGQWVHNTATGTGTDSLSAPVNLTAAADVQIAAPNPAAYFNKWDSNDPASLKGIFEYYFWVKHAGNVPLSNYVFTDDLPKEFIPTYIYPGSDDTGQFTSTINVWYKTTTNAAWRLLPGSPFTTAPKTDPYVDLSTIGLAAGEIVSSVKYEFGTLPVGYDGNWRPRVYGTMGDGTTGADRTGAAITGLPKTISNTYNVSYDYGGTTYTGSDTETTEIMGTSPMPSFTIFDAVPSSYFPQQEIKWSLRMENNWTASEPLINPVYATLLPANLEFIPGSVVATEGPFATGAITATVIDNYAGTGRQLVKFAFAGNHPVAWTTISGISDDWAQYMDFRTTVRPGSAAGSFQVEYHLIGSGNTLINSNAFQTTRTDTYDIDGDGNTTETHGTSNIGHYTINTSTSIDSVLWVKGQLDAAFNRYPDAGFALPGGSVQYKLIVSNPGNVPLTSIRVMDILPWVGDVGVILHSQARGSTFAPALTSTVTAPAGITVKYGTSSNPVRTDLDATLTSPAGAVSGSFSTTAPTPLSNTKSLLFDFGALVLNPAESKEITWTMNIPAGTTIGQVAWNSFAHRSQSAANGQALPPSEPVKVGTAIPITVGSFVWSDTNNNGVQDVGEPGISGATLQIFKSNGTAALDPLGTPVAAVTSDSNGLYAFGALADGDYFVRVTPPGGYVPTNNQVPDPDNDIDTDSNIDLSRTPPAGSYESGVFTFAVNTEPTVEPGAGGTQDDVDDNNGNMTVDFGFFVANADFGDYTGFASASSAVDANLKLGTAVTDAEAANPTTGAASADDTTGTDDEDGVTLPASAYSGSFVTITANVTNNTGANAYLNGWIDFNRNNAFDAGEQVVANHTVATGVTNGSLTFYVAVPTGLTAGTAGARFRLTSQSNPGPTGLSTGTGEVEDYTINIGAAIPCGTELFYNPSFEYGSLRPLSTAFTAVGTDDKFPNSTLQATFNAKTYSGIDSTAIPGWEVDRNSWVDAPGKASNGTKMIYYPRLPGICITLPIQIGAVGAGAQGSNPNVVLALGKTYRVGFDWTAFDRGQPNGNAAESDGLDFEFKFWDGSGNELGTTINITSGFRLRSNGLAAPSTQTLRAWTSLAWNSVFCDFTLPASLPAGTVRPAIQLTSKNGMGLLLDNVSIKEVCPVDFSDHLFSGTSSASQTASTNLFIGTNATDGEAADPSDANANQDDTTGFNDEDLAMPAFTVGNATNLVIPVTIPSLASLSGSTSRINVFADWNGDGDVADAGETQTAQTVAATGTTNVTFALTPPAGTNAGTKYLRIRVTEGSTAPTFAGASALEGEVEDYAITVAAGNLAIGNLVWNDTNNNGVKDGAEAGISGLTVQLFSPGADDAIGGNGANADTQVGSNVTTGAGGAYSFSGFVPGKYFIKLLPSVTYPLASSTAATTDNNVDNNNDGSQPGGSGTAIFSPIIDMQTGTESVADGDADANTNYTVDFGIYGCPTITLAALSANTVGTAYSSSTAASGGTAPYTYAVTSGALPAWAAFNTSTGAITGTSNSTASATFTITATDAIGCSGARAYTLAPTCPAITMTPAPGALTQGLVGAAYSQPLSSSGSTGTLVWSVTSGTLPTGLSINSATGAITGTPTAATSGVSGASISIKAQDQYVCAKTQAYTLKVCPTLIFPASMPSPVLLVPYSASAAASGGTAPYTYSLSSAPGWMSINSSTGQITGTPLSLGAVSFTVNATDANGCPGSASYTTTTVSVSIGNLVWNDFNNNGTKDASETGLSGATVQLFSPGADNAIGGAGANADTQVGSNITTTATGAYSFASLAPGKYFIKVTPPAGYIPGGTPATTDNNVDNNNDGSQPAGLGTPIYSPIIDLAVAAESITDGDVDANTNMTVDFGLFAGIQLGDLVWNDANDNATKDAAESGISGLTVELLNGAGNTVIATTTTNASGQYGFTVYTAGSYRVRVTPNTTYPLASTTHATTDNAVDNNNDGDQPGKKGGTSTSPVITLTAAGEPGSSGSSNTENTIDFGFRGCSTISNAPTTLVSGNVGAPYSATVTASGGVAPYTYAVTSGSLPSGLALNAATGVISGTTSVSGNHIVTITATDANLCTGATAITLPISATPTYDYGDYSPFPLASSFASNSLRMGLAVDADASSPANGTASGDDTSNTDDEDGIFEPINLVPGVAGLTVVKVTNTTGAVAYLNAWIDFNRNGSPGDAGEQVATNIPIATGSTNVNQTINFTTPAGALVGFTAIRLRLTNTPSPSPSGAVGTGEVEDYPVNTCPTLGYAYGTQSGDLYQIDVATGVVSQAATLPAGFERSNGAAFAQDRGQDGVVFYTTGTLTLQVGAWDRMTGTTNVCGDLSSFGVPTGNPIYSADYFNGWYYFVINNTDDLWKARITGSAGAYTITSASKVSDMWSDTRSHGYGDIVITPGGIMYAHASRNGGGVDFFTCDLNQATPTATLLGNPPYMHNGITFGLDGKLYGGLGVNSQNADWFEVSLANGASTYLRDGVVSGMSDMTMGACTPSQFLIDNDPWANKDLGDYSLFTGAQSTVNTNIRLGALVDGESTIANNITATSDDTLGVDDEDGVTFNGQFVQGQTATVTINRVNTSGANAYLNGWIDFNNDGMLDGAGEQIITNVLIPSGTNASATYTFTVPANAVTGDIGARFRITNVNTTGWYGDSGSGEVEDHIATILPSLCIGNLVWYDVNNNGIKDASEPGLAGATVQLFRSGADNTVNTGDDVQVGANLTTGASGSYIFTNLGPAKYYVRVTPPAGGYIPGGTPATTDNDVDNNNDGSQPGGIGTSLYSPIVELTVNGESITDGDTDPTSNFTIDFGLWPGIKLGNEVWNDANDNATRDVAESGISGLLVELINAGTNAVITTTTTNASGIYGFTIYTAGTYKVRVTPNSGLPISSTSVTALDNGVDNDNNGSQPGTRDTPSTSPTITLTAGGEPGSAGTTNTENTIDFGFRACPTVSITPTTVANGVWGIPYTSVQFSSTGHIGTATWSAAGLPAGLSVSPSGLLSGTPGVVGTFPFTVTETDAKACVVSRSLTITILCPTLTMTSVPDPFPTAIEKRAFTAGFTVAGGLGPRTFTVAGGTLPPGLSLAPDGTLSGTPTTAGTYTFTIQSVDALPCSVQQQFTLIVLPPLSIGNLVFIDANGNGHYDSGEGLDGVTLQLYDNTQTPGVSTPLATTVTSSGGRYIFEGLLPGYYRVHVPAAMFQTGAPLATTISIAEGLSGDDDVGENGINSNAPDITGISSGLVTVQLGQAPTDLNGETGFDHASDNAFDAAIDLTIDFGFANPLGVGNMIFVDANTNGHYDAGEGVAGVKVELYRSTDIPGAGSPVSSQFTDANGHYLFDYLVTGSYFVYIPSSEFNPGGGLYGKVSMTGSGTGGVDDSADENGLDDLAPILNGIRSNTFTLANNGAPTNATGENGYLASEDSRDDNNYDLTIDLGFRLPDPNAVGVGNAVFLDLNGNHFFDTGEGVDGVTVRLFASTANPATTAPLATTVTASGGSYLFAGIQPGSYFIQIPGSMFASGAPLYRTLSLPGQGGDSGIDDDQDENGDDPAVPATSGVRSTNFDLAPDDEPINTASEFGSNAFIDDTDDNNTDLTIDFGFYRPVGVGNLVFIDANRNGHYNTGEGVDGVRVELYLDNQSPGFDSPIAFTTTSGGGFYLFSNLVPGFYIVHIPTSNFAPNGVLEAFTPIIGQGADDGTDDDLDENGSDPAQAFAEGVSSLTLQLATGSEPTDQTTEHGAGATSDNATDSDVDLTVDFGFYAAAPASFAQWQAQNQLGGQNGPTLDPDGDGITNLGEYAAGLSPGAGVLPYLPFEINLNAITNQVDAWVRKLQVLDDVTLTIQGIDDLSLSPAGWTDITTINPEIVSTTNGVQTVAYRNLEQIATFTGGKGFVRLHLALDANHDGTAEATYNSDAWGWARRALAAQIITYSNPFLKNAVFTGTVTSVTGNALDVAASAGGDSIAAALTGTIPYYIEVLSGVNEGHRFEVNEAASSATTIMLEPTNTLNTLAAIPTTLAGARVALRAHSTLAEWLPPAKFRATNNSSTADRVMFYSGSTFATTWLFSNLGSPKWVNDASLADRGTRVMDPTEAILIQPRSTSAPAFVNLGLVRASKFACPIKQGTRLIAGGWPMDQSFTSRGILFANGFTGATSASRADRIQIWNGDTTPGATTYVSHYLLNAASIQQWVRVGDSSLANENNLPLFKSLRGVYFNSINGKADYIAPRPWTP